MDMKSEWKTYTVQELIDLGMLEAPMDGNHGNLHPKVSDYVLEGIPFIMANDLVNGKIDYKKCAHITEAQARQLKKGFAHPGDVLLTHEATIGRTALVGNEYDTIVLTPQITYYRVKKGISNRYLKAYFDSKEFQELLSNWAGSGSTRAYLGITAQRKLPILLPSIDIQNKIASYCECIDGKITVNSMINDNLLRQAQALFKLWFVDFEPFSNQKPSGWSVSTLGNVSIMGAGGDKPQNVSPIKSNLCQYPIYSNGLSEEGLYGFTDKPKIFKESVTVSARGTIGFVCLRHIPYVPTVRLVTLIPKTEIISAKYLYLWLKQLHITGTGTTQQQLTVPDFQKTEILVPSKEIVTLFTATVEPIFEKIWANQSENEKLSSLRDTLLPKLMSGEIDVSDIQL